MREKGLNDRRINQTGSRVEVQRRISLRIPGIRVASNRNQIIYCCASISMRRKVQQCPLVKWIPQG